LFSFPHNVDSDVRRVISVQFDGYVIGRRTAFDWSRGETAREDAHLSKRLPAMGSGATWDNQVPSGLYRLRSEEASLKTDVEKWWASESEASLRQEFSSDLTALRVRNH